MLLMLVREGRTQRVISNDTGWPRAKSNAAYIFSVLSEFFYHVHTSLAHLVGVLGLEKRFLCGERLTEMWVGEGGVMFF